MLIFNNNVLHQEIQIDTTSLYFAVFTCKSGCQLETGGSGRHGAPSRNMGSFANISRPFWPKCLSTISDVCIALHMFDVSKEVNVTPEFFSLFPVNSACSIPNWLRLLSSSHDPFRLYCPCRMRIMWRITLDFFFSNCSATLFSSSAGSTSRFVFFGGFTKLYGSLLWDAIIPIK